MKHHKRGRIFGRVKRQRTALLRSLALNLLKSGEMVTTEEKAKEVRPFIERLITKAKTDTVASRRNVASGLASITGAKMLAAKAADFKTRPGGYTRIIKLPRRLADGAAMAHISFVK